MSSDEKTYNIKVEHITRVEGHGNILIDTKKGVVEDVKLSIVEANRFFESFVRGQEGHEVPMTISRICGICCVGHMLAAIQAVEDAYKITPSDQTILLRKALTESAFLQSHVLHVYFLAVPDFLGVKSVLPLAATHTDVVKRALKLKKLANDYTQIIGGRALHPQRPTLNGFRKLPTENEIEQLIVRLKEAVPDIQETIAITKTLNIPAYERDTEYVSLHHPDEYALYNGDIISTDTNGKTLPVSKYLKVTNEFSVPHSTTKWAKFNRDSYAVGSLARVNNNFDQLRPEAKQAAEDLGLKVPCCNPYMNNVAQVVEVVHCAYNSIAMLEQLLNTGIKEEDISYKPRKGRGYGATEVPRGILFHDYSFDRKGRCTAGNAIIPTGQNVNNIERDMKKFVPEMLPEMSQDELALKMEMLVRAYDPCISCSVHMLDVKFK